MGQKKRYPNLVTGVILLLFLSVSLYLRIYLPYDQIFTDDYIRFSSVDAYYHMRLVDNLMHNFPHFLTFDPYTYFPHGSRVDWPPFYDWLLSGIILLVSLGSPARSLIDTVGAYLPAVLGAITIIPVYFIGKALFNRTAGIIAAALITLLPGEFLSRSTLGFSDHHAAETLFSTVFILFLFLSIKAARHERITFENIKRGQFAAMKAPLVYSILTGVCLGIYLLTWVGGLLFILIITTYFTIQFVIDHLRNESTDYLSIVAVISLVTALIVSLPLMPQTLFIRQFLPSMIIAIVMPVVLNIVSRLMRQRGLRPVYYPLLLVVLIALGLAGLYIVSPGLFKSMTGAFDFFTRSGAYLTIGEAKPLLFPEGSFSLEALWDYFTTASFLSLLAIGILIFLAGKRNDPGRNLLLVWSLAMLAVTLGQRRFAYYFAVNVALLSGYCSIIFYLAIRFVVDYFKTGRPGRLASQILDMEDLEKRMTVAAEPPRKARDKKGGKKGSRRSFTDARYLSIGLWLVIVMALVVFPNIRPALTTAASAPPPPNDAWYESLLWLKENTPDPFNNPDGYYELYEKPPARQDYDYPESAYGVMAWWDYGHWITRISHRIPVANPFQQGAEVAADYFLASDETAADRMLDELGVRYVIIEYRSVSTSVLLPAIITWRGEEPGKYFETFYFSQKLTGNEEKVTCYFPEYFRALATRLFVFEGRGVTPENIFAVSYQVKERPDGSSYNLITSAEQFHSYEEAETFVADHPQGGYRIVSTDPFSSPVPLEPLEHYELSFSSNATIRTLELRETPMVKIFEYSNSK